ncbi:MAG: hypothetical protein R3A46_15070 [Thermomicrobiales bacterium]
MVAASQEDASRDTAPIRMLELDALRQGLARCRRNRGSTGGTASPSKRFGHLNDHNLLQLADDVRDGGAARQGHAGSRSSAPARGVITVLPVRDPGAPTGGARSADTDPWFLRMSYGYRPGKSPRRRRKDRQAAG